jgi:hypothetical protein
MPLNITDVDAFTDPIVVPTSADPKTSFGYLRQALQGLANRTRNIYNKIGAASGLATLDASSRLVQLPKPALIADSFAQGSAGGTITCTTAGTWYDVTGASISLTVVAGDLIRAHAVTQFRANGSGSCTTRIVIVDADSTIVTDATGAAESGANATGAGFLRFTQELVRTAAAGGTATVKVQVKGSTNANTADFDYANVWARQIRP